MTSLDIIGYHLNEQLYNGSRTIVYRGERAVDNKPVVIKLLKNPYPSLAELVQFRNQYTIAKNLDIPGIIRHYCLEAHQNSYALVIEDYGGVSLGDYIKYRCLNLNLLDFLVIALQITDILAGLYQQRVIHKNIKPANILIHPETKQVKLIDFSIASLLPKETQEIQNPNVLEGTLAYLSPEQTGRMNRGIDYRTDYYSLGVTFYELLTGRLPFEVDDPIELIHCHIAKCPPMVDKINPEIPQVISSMVDKLMAKNAEDRYQSALGLKHDLEICLHQLKETGRIENFVIGQGDICDRFVIPEKLYGREKEDEKQAAISLENARLYQESQQQEAQYRGIFEAVSDGLVIAEIDTGKAIEANPAYSEMLGYQPEEILQIDTINVVHPDSHSKFADFLVTTKAGKKFQCEAVILRKDGTTFNVEVRAVQIIYKGKPCSLSVIRDVTERRHMEIAIQQAQMQVIQSEKMSSLGNLVAGVAHEVNNPLGFIKGSLSNIGEYIQDLLSYIECIHQNHPQLAPSITELAEEIDLQYICEDLPKLIGSMAIATERIKEISTSLRTFSRADTSEKIACDIHEGLNSTLLILKYRLKANEFRPEIKIIKLYDERASIKCFLGQLNQVFMNILANAIDAIDEESQKCSFSDLMNNPKQISIKTELRDNNFIVSIKDNGPGMSNTVQSQIFDHLFTTKEVGKGTGLGLAIARQIIEKTHGGKLSCVSTLGEGTEFIIELPL